MSRNDIIDVEPVGSARDDSLKTWGWVSYLLHLIVAVAAVVPGAQVSIALLIIALVMDFSGLVLAEAVLSYVGIGVDPTMISFGTMINSARMELGREPVVWWSLAAAFTTMFILVLAANLFADAVRDAFDPRAA